MYMTDEIVRHHLHWCTCC